MTVNPSTKNHSESLRIKSSNLKHPLLPPFSIEILPKLNFDCEKIQQFLPAKTRVFIPHLPKTTLPEIVDTVKSLKLAGFEPVPHIAARRMSDEVELKNLLSSLYDLKVQELLLIAGSRNEPIGEYQHCNDLLNSAVFNQFRFKRLLFAGHPEGHINIAQEEIEAALLKKVQLANKRGYETAIVTQFCFNKKVILHWFLGIVKAGIEQPVYIGITGPAKFKTLLRYSAICGVSTSASLFIKQPRQMWNLLFNANTDYFLNTLIKHPEIQNKVTGFHVYSFGGLDETIQWVEKISTSKQVPTTTISTIFRRFLNKFFF